MTTATNDARNQVPAGYTATWHQTPTVPFDDAEFYTPGPVLTLAGPDGRRAHVVSEGSRYVTLDTADPDAPALRTATDFRSACPTGTIPEDGNGATWENNGWFNTYLDGQDEPCDELSYGLAEATAAAVAALAG